MNGFLRGGAGMLAVAAVMAVTPVMRADEPAEAGKETEKMADEENLSGGELGEVTVTVQETRQSKGMTVVVPTGADVKASSTALSLFEKLPLAGLTANPVTRTLSVDGGTPVILINGVKADINDFNSLLPKDIAKVEYSRVVPTRYADGGATGLVSITLKKRDDGGQVALWGRSALQTVFADASLRASYHQGKSQFSVLYTPSWRNYQAVYDNVTESYAGDDFRVNLEEHDRNPFNYFYQQARVKYDYVPDESTLFSATFRITPLTHKGRTIADISDSQLGEYDNYSLTTSKDMAPSLDLFLRRDFGERNTLEVQVVGTLSSSDYRRDYRYDFAGDVTENYVMNVDSRRRSLISEVCYSHRFSNRTQLSAGVQNTLSHSRNTYLTSDYAPVLTENNNYVYGNLGQRVGKVYLNLATGVKLFWIENDRTRRHFVRNLSSAQASWTISDMWSLQGTFQYAPSIPSLSALTDYPQQTSPYLVSNGNPDLKVAERLNYRVGVSFQRGRVSANFSSELSDVRNDVITDVVYLGDRLFLSQSVNARKRQAWSNWLAVKISGVAGFGANVQLGLSRFVSAGDGWTHTLTSPSANLSLWWNKGPFTLSYGRNFPGKYLSGHMVVKNENYDMLNADWRPDKHWTIGVGWMYMFARKGTQYPTWNYSAVNPSVRERYISNNADMVTLSVSYNADFGSIFRTARRSLNNADNASSLLKM